MSKLPEQQHHDLPGHVKAKPNARHIHPHDLVPVRVSRERGFAAPGLDTPAERRRPAREAGTDRDHPVNKALRDEDKSLFGPQLGEHQKDMAVTPIHGESGNSHVAEPPPSKL
jgi:hypothetical protein